MLSTRILIGRRNALSFGIITFRWSFWWRWELVLILILDFSQWSMHSSIVTCSTLVMLSIYFMMVLLLRMRMFLLMFSGYLTHNTILLILVWSGDFLVLMLTICLMMRLSLMVDWMLLMVRRLLMMFFRLVNWFMRNEFMFRLFLIQSMFRRDNDFVICSFGYSVFRGWNGFTFPDVV